MIDLIPKVSIADPHSRCAKQVGQESSRILQIKVCLLTLNHPFESNRRFSLLNMPCLTTGNTVNVLCRVADPHHFNADPGPAFHFNKDPIPDAAFQFL